MRRLSLPRLPSLVAEGELQVLPELTGSAQVPEQISAGLQALQQGIADGATTVPLQRNIDPKP
jgi:hypothetical protein